MCYTLFVCTVDHMPESIGIDEAIRLRLIFYTPERLRDTAVSKQDTLADNCFFNVVHKKVSSKTKAERECDYSAVLIIDEKRVTCYFKSPTT